jgi:hypothetical protein
MTYFTDAEYGLNLCCSADGFNWSALNDGKAVMVPEIGQKGLRDPAVFRKRDGSFVVVATDMRGTNWGDQSQYIQCYDSPDLCSFTNARLLQVHDGGMHAWAPEVFYDPVDGRYGIYWSGDTDYNRIYVNYTHDFETVTERQVLFDPGYDVIDANIVSHDGALYLFFKDERASGKSIKAARSVSGAPGTFEVFTPDFLTSAYTEGPAVFQGDGADWLMYCDLFAEGGVFECWKASDLNSTVWDRVIDFGLPAGVKHAGVVAVTQGELNAIRKKYGAA